jgi:hypothetical protein
MRVNPLRRGDLTLARFFKAGNDASSNPPVAALDD